MGDLENVKATYAKFVPGLENAHLKEQWCYAAVATADAKTSCNFATASKGLYTAALYCETIEGWFYRTEKPVNVTAKDNGGKPVGLTLTYKKEINDVTNNDVVLKICGKLAETLAVPYSRVTDAYGGFFGNPSAYLPAAAPKAAPAAPAKSNNTTANKTRLLNATANTTANATAAKTEWTLNLFVQPDPFAETVDNAATAASASGTAAVAAVNSVTKTAYGDATAKAAAITEAAVKFNKAPTATGGAK